jgi:opacity protein-like surface antigen
MTQSYVGAGVSAGALDDGQVADAPFVGGNVQGRYAIPKTPISLRGSTIFNDQAVAIVPTLSYDLPVNNRTNVYLGVGYSFVPDTGNASPLGNQSTVVFSPGIETSVSKNLVLYSDAKIGLNGFEQGDATSMSVQVGAGYRF